MRLHILLYFVAISSLFDSRYVDFTRYDYSRMMMIMYPLDNTLAHFDVLLLHTIVMVGYIYLSLEILSFYFSHIL